MMRLNKATCVKCPSNRFITFFFCVLDAGHRRAALRQRRPQSADHRAGLGRGADARRRRPRPRDPVDRAVSANSASGCERGDMLVIYSDGVTEANNLDYDEFDEERFIEVLRNHRTEPAAKIVEAVTRSRRGVHRHGAAGRRYHARGRETGLTSSSRSTEPPVISCGGSPPAICCATISRRACTRIPGSRIAKSPAAMAQKMPPIGHSPRALRCDPRRPRPAATRSAPSP